MRRIWTFVIAVAIAVLLVLPAQAQVNADGSDWTLQSLVPAIANLTNKFWTEEFDGLNIEYRPPTSLSAYFIRTRTACGRATVQTAFYCTLSHSIHYEVNFLNRALTRIGDFAAASIIAHEWGHAIQTQLGLFSVGPVQRELQADCFAGAFGKWLDEEDLLTEGDFEEGRALFAQLGDSEETSPDSPTAHGTSEQRVESYEKGFRDGVSGCMT